MSKFEVGQVVNIVAHVTAMDDYMGRATVLEVFPAKGRTPAEYRVQLQAGQEAYFFEHRIAPSDVLTGDVVEFLTRNDFVAAYVQIVGAIYHR